MRWLVLAFSLLAFPAWAVTPEERLSDPALEERARQISKGLRCVVCQNQSIDDSNAEIAVDMRRLVRERVVAGDTDGAVRGYLVERYGEFVLLRPRFAAHTALLWAAPVLFAGAGGLWLLLRLRRRDEDRPPEQLTETEEGELARLLEPEGR